MRIFIDISVYIANVQNEIRTMSVEVSKSSFNNWNDTF